MAQDRPGDHQPIQYGRKFAETDERYHAHVLERQLEAMAHEEEQPSIPPPVSPTPGSTPIGALPAQSSRATLEPGLLREAVNEAGRRYDALQVAAKQFVKQVLHFAKLPVEVVSKGLKRQPVRRQGWS